MELSSSVASTAAQARLLRLPSGRRPGHAGCISFRIYAVTNKGMKAMPPVGASFQRALPRWSSIQAAKEKKHNVPCYQRQEAPEIEAKSMDEVYNALAEHLLSVLKNIKHLDSKYIVGLAGPPGAGKSTVASEVVRRVNMLWSQKCAKGSASRPTEEIAAMLPMDGFHLYRSQLDAMEDPKEAHARRGAPWTFNPSLLLKCLQTLRTEGSVYAPSFDHGVGDPVENDIFVKATAQNSDR
uniref:Phosphoribulokinase/uridine kinase domain-containing protein n=1 Tax=Arundo donax TaxID=35708 RepID=A0A0A9CP79_ARUDO